MDNSRGWLHGLRHLVLGLIAFGALVPGSASAECTSSNGVDWHCDDQGEAYAKAHTIPPKYPHLDPGPTFVVDWGGRTYMARNQYPNTEVINAGYADWPVGQSCDVREDQTGLYTDGDPETSDAVCDEGCLFDPSLVIEPDGSSQLVWAPTGSVCTESDAPPPQPDADGDGVPDEDDAFPDDPDESADSDGDGMGDNEDAMPDDEDNGADDGEGDESDNESAGGGTCAAPPTCTGDGIACATLYQSWRTRCAVERMAGIENGGVTEGEGDGDGEGDEGPGEDEEDDPWGEGDGSTPEFNVQNIDSELLNTSGFMGGGSCPTWGPIDILGTSYALPQVHCDILEWIGFLVVAVALVVAARILGS